MIQVLCEDVAPGTVAESHVVIEDGKKASIGRVELDACFDRDAFVEVGTLEQGTLWISYGSARYQRGSDVEGPCTVYLRLTNNTAANRILSASCDVTFCEDNCGCS